MDGAGGGEEEGGGERVRESGEKSGLSPMGGKERERERRLLREQQEGREGEKNTGADERASVVLGGGEFLMKRCQACDVRATA